MDKIRNFSIIAHIDHGKSTLSDRFLELTGLKDPTDTSISRLTDRLELEQEKGITIKLQAARMEYKGYILNLIDTPGHVDFTYEVSRSLKACEGALLLIDASQGVQAQTLSTTQKAQELGLTIIPVINKIDIPFVDIEQRKRELSEMLGFEPESMLLASGKDGRGVPEILDAIIDRVPSPSGSPDLPLQTLIFDSFYHEHKGVVASVRIVNGSLAFRSHKKLYLLRHKNDFTPKEIGFFNPDFVRSEELKTGEVGYIATGVKDIRLFAVGDTISDSNSVDPLPGYVRPQPNLFATLFPTEPEDYQDFSEALTKLSLNDASLTISQQRSSTLGAGYRCGFLGTLHLEIIQERLEREHGVSIVITAPSVKYTITMHGGETRDIEDSDDFPDPATIIKIEEPWTEVRILTPQAYIGPVMELCKHSRGEYKDTRYYDSSHSPTGAYVLLTYDIPLVSLITKFFDRLKSLSSGYASLDYTITDRRPADIVKVTILVNQTEVTPLSFLETRENAASRSRTVLAYLKETIPQHQFKIAIQAAIGGTIIAREDISARRKDVTAKLYGGDVTRKRKLLEKQKKGKKRLREIGGVRIPQKAFLAVLQT